MQTTQSQISIQEKETIALLKAIGEAIKEAGPQGIPSGTLYAMLMQYGMTLPRYQQIIRSLKICRKINEVNNLLTWTGC